MICSCTEKGVEEIRYSKGALEIAISFEQPNRSLSKGKGSEQMGGDRCYGFGQ